MYHLINRDALFAGGNGDRTAGNRPVGRA